MWGVKTFSHSVAGSTGPSIEERLLQSDVAPNLVYVESYPIPGLLSEYLWEIGANYWEHEVVMRLADEESDYDFLAKNPGSAARGLFQYMPDSWRDQCQGSIWNYKEQTRCALKDLRAGMISQWEVTRKW